MSLASACSMNGDIRFCSGHQSQPFSEIHEAEGCFIDREIPLAICSHILSLLLCEAST